MFVVFILLLFVILKKKKKKNSIKKEGGGLKIVNCNVKCFCGAQGGSMLEIHVATMRRVVMEIIGKRGREWGGTWVVLGSRKSCDHMCMCSPLSLSLSPPLVLWLWAHPSLFLF